MRRRHGKNRGFTLIELSIVLVIIGLIVGGVLVGQDLIAAAAVRAQIAQIEKYNTAANTFVTKYGYLPGDIPNPYASNFGFIARGSSEGQGDGNGLLEGYTGVGYCEAGGENTTFWADLSSAGFIDGVFNSTNETSRFNSGNGVGWSGNGPLIPQLFPTAKIGGQHTMVYVWSGGTSLNGGGTSNGINYFSVSNVEQSHGNDGALDGNGGGMTVAQAFSIDNKIDDGLPQSGNVQAFYLNCAPFSCQGASGTNVAWAAGNSTVGASPGSSVSPSSSTCYDDGGNSSNTMQYSMTKNNGAYANCALSFKMQAAAR